MGMSSIEVKKANRNSVIRYMLHNGVETKHKIASALSLSVPTVTQALKELEEAGLVVAVGTMDSMGGRKAMGFRCVKDYKIAIGIDITPNHVNIVVVDLALQALYVKRENICMASNDASYSELYRFVERAISESGVCRENILGIGISLPAIVDESNMEILAMHEKMQISYKFYEEIENLFDFPVVLCNDANCAALAELTMCKFSENKIYFFISQSVGGAIITDGKIDVGQTLRAGEFGHMILIPEGRACYCGRNGCAGAYLSTSILADAAAGLLERFFVDLDTNQAYQNIWNEYLDKLAISIHNLIMVFDRKIIIGGYLGQFIDRYIPMLWEKIIQIDHYLADFPVCIESSELKIEAASMGAAAVFTEQYLVSREYIT